MMTIKYKIVVVTLAGTLLSCNTAKYLEQPPVDVNALYGDIAVTDPTTIASVHWEDIFTDPLLQNLIMEGLANNTDLQIATQRVLAAEASFRQGRTSLFPSINAQATAGHVRNSVNSYPAGPRDIETYQANIQASWEIDIWGKLNAAKRSAYASLLAGEAGKNAVQTRIMSGIITTYYRLMALDEQIEITRNTIQTTIDLVETMKVLKENGAVTEAAVVQSEAVRYAAEASIPDLEQAVRETENQLCLLLGRPSGSIERSKLMLQETPMIIKTGVPAQLLENRPDVMQAEYDLASAFELTRNARRYFYPSLTITASGGLESRYLDNLLNVDAFVANVIGGLAAPLINKRANVTRLEIAKTQQETALLNFKNALLSAGQEVNNAMGSFNSSVQKIAARKYQLEALDKSVDYTKELLIYGNATYIEVLNAQQSRLSAQLSHVNDHLQKLTSIVTLYRALGGGWK